MHVHFDRWSRARHVAVWSACALLVSSLVGISGPLSRVSALSTASNSVALPRQGPGRVERPTEPLAGQYIVVLRPVRAGTEGQVSGDLVRGYGGELVRTFRHALQGFVVRMTDAEALALSFDPRVASVSQDGLVHGSASQSPTPSWGLDRIDQHDLPLDSSFGYNATGAGVHAYIIDSGIRTSHSDFGGRASIGADFIGDGQNGNDCVGHGTHVAGTVGGTKYGVAKNVTLIAVRVLGCDNTGPYSAIIAGIDWVTANHISPAVANMSLGGAAYGPVDTAVQNSIGSGVTYTIAAMNTNEDACNYSPARAPNALTVAATDSSDARASFSNYGTCVDLFAPGVSITSDWNTNDTAANTISGTSMAAPHVAGTAALYLQGNSSATPAQVATAIITNATTGHVTNGGTGSPNLLNYEAFIGASPPPTTTASTTTTTTSTTTTSTTTTRGTTTSSTTTTAPPPSVPPPPPTADISDDTYFPLSNPSRVYDSRQTTPLAHLESRAIQVNGVSGVPTDATAIVANVTVVDPQSSGYLTVFPTGVTRPNTSTHNFASGENFANMVVMQVGAGGYISVFDYLDSGGGSVHVLIDIVGYTRADNSGTRLHTMDPVRVLDTRTGTGLPKMQFGPGVTQDLSVRGGTTGVPDDAESVVLNMTITNATHTGSFVTVWPTGSAKPNVSNLNNVEGVARANLVVARVGIGGQVSITNASGSTDIIADVVGYFSPGEFKSGGVITGATPVRILDTRPASPFGQDEVRTVVVAGIGGIPATAKTAILKVTAVVPTSAGFLTVWPEPLAPPNVSNVNFGPGMTIPNLVVTRISTNGTINIYNALGMTHVLIDVLGYAD